MDYTIETARPEDLDGLTACYLRYAAELAAAGLQYSIQGENIPQVLAGRIKSRLLLTAVARVGERLVGFVFCSVSRLGGEYLCEGMGVVGYLNDIYVEPDCRKAGVAAALFAHAEDWLRESGVKAVELQVLTGNCGGQQFWQTRGLQPVATLCYKKL